MLAERGTEVDHITILRWVLRFVPKLEEAFQTRKRRPGTRVRLDETYILIKSKWYYLYRAIDKQVETIDFLLTENTTKRPLIGF